MELINEFIATFLKEDKWYSFTNKERFYNYGLHELCQQAYELGLLERKIEDEFYKGTVINRKFYFKLK